MASPSSNLDQRLDCLEAKVAKLDSAICEMLEIFDAMNSKVNRLIGPSSTSPPSQIYPQKTYPVAPSSPNSSSPQTPILLPYPSTPEKQSTKDTTTPPPSHDHCPKSSHH
jgi:hypothetical protein